MSHFLFIFAIGHMGIPYCHRLFRLCAIGASFIYMDKGVMVWEST
jgi:hypothetical protein